MSQQQNFQAFCAITWGFDCTLNARQEWEAAAKQQAKAFSDNFISPQKKKKGGDEENKEGKTETTNDRAYLHIYCADRDE